MIEPEELTITERRALVRLRKLAKGWPKTLSLFSNNGSLEIHKNGSGEPYTNDTYVESVYGITNDGGDRD